jgi:hypothetical protein
MKQTPKERWEALKAKLADTDKATAMREIAAIDKDTPWGLGVEPEWWLEMMNADRDLKGIPQIRI